VIPNGPSPPRITRELRPIWTTNSSDTIKHCQVLEDFEFGLTGLLKITGTLRGISLYATEKIMSP